MRIRGLPLSTVVTGTVVTLIAATTLAVAMAGWRANQRTVDMLWHELAASVAESATLETVRLVDAAVPFTEVNHDLIVRGELQPTDHAQLLRYAESALDAHPSFTWVSWGDPEGTYLSAYRWPEDDGVLVRRTERTQELGPDGAPATRYVDDERRDGAWTTLSRDLKPVYDPRVRPWYTAAAATPDGVWTKPFVFASRQQPGVAYARAVRADGELLGVWGIEFEMQPLSDFLAQLEVGEHGRVYILQAERGLVIGHPTGDILDAEGAFLTAAEHPDPMLSSAWNAWTALPAAERAEPFEVGGYLAMAEPFPDATGIPWVVLSVVPEEDFLGAAREELRTAAVLGGAALLIALLLGVVLSRSIAGALAGLREELLRVARFDLGASAASPSPFREINEMGEATDRMKQGLEGFARYVPRELVRQLVAAGQEARVGAERREVTILFTDIAGFTPLVESTPPDRMMAALGDYFEAMNVVIAQTDGTVAQYLGDGIMAFWGAPRELEEPALQCGRAALGMLAEVRRLVDEAEATGQPVLHTRIGLDTGTVMVGNIGAHERFSYGILGDAVNTTSRIEGINKVYGTSILVGPTAAAAIGQRLVLRPVDEVLPVGKTTPMWIHELVAEPDAVPADVAEALAHYAQGLEAYRAGRFDEAVAHFEAAEAAREGGDPPSEHMAARCRDLVADPPADWDGVWRMTRK